MNINEMFDRFLSLERCAKVEISDGPSLGKQLRLTATKIIEKAERKRPTKKSDVPEKLPQDARCDKTREDETIQEKTREGKSRQDKTRRGKARQDKRREDPRQDKRRQEQTRLDRARQETRRHGKTR